MNAAPKYALSRALIMAGLFLAAALSSPGELRADGWVAQTSGTLSNLYSVSFADANNGAAVGTSGMILHTTNGGANWVRQVVGTTVWFYGVHFVDANTGTVVGEAGTVLHTTDGGTTWTS